MKIFCFTFIVYIVVLSVQPCQDFLAAFDDGDKVNAEVAHVSELPAEEADDCSPFCICSCCSHAVADRCVFRSIAADTVIATTELKPNTYRNPYTNGFHTSIWQPPKA